MYALNARTQAPELSIELLESICAAMPDTETAFLYEDAAPVALLQELDRIVYFMEKENNAS